MYENLSRSLCKNGFQCFRFDRRGVGDSEGEDPGFRGSASDIIAAANAFRAQCPQLQRLIGFGLCDGAAALALFGAQAGLSGLILVNPWLIEAAAGEPAPAAIRRHYLDRLASREGWRKLATGSLSYKKLLQGLRKAASTASVDLAEEVGHSLGDGPPSLLVLARGDATAIAAEAEWNSVRFAAVRSKPIYVESNSHTFANPEDPRALLHACLEALDRLS